MQDGGELFCICVEFRQACKSRGVFRVHQQNRAIFLLPLGAPAARQANISKAQVRRAIKWRYFENFSPGALGIILPALARVNVAQSVPRLAIRKAVGRRAILFFRLRKSPTIKIEFAESVPRLRAQRINLHRAAEFRFSLRGFTLGGINTAQMNVRACEIRAVP